MISKLTALERDGRSATVLEVSDSRLGLLSISFPKGPLVHSTSSGQ